MPFDLFYYVFLLDFAFEAAERVFQGLPVLKSYFSQPINTPFSVLDKKSTERSGGDILAPLAA